MHERVGLDQHPAGTVNSQKTYARSQGGKPTSSVADLMGQSPVSRKPIKFHMKILLHLVKRPDELVNAAIQLLYTQARHMFMSNQPNRWHEMISPRFYQSVLILCWASRSGLRNSQDLACMCVEMEARASPRLWMAFKTNHTEKNNNCPSPCVKKTLHVKRLVPCQSKIYAGCESAHARSAQLLRDITVPGSCCLAGISSLCWATLEFAGKIPRSVHLRNVP